MKQVDLRCVLIANKVKVSLNFYIGLIDVGFWQLKFILRSILIALVLVLGPTLPYYWSNNIFVTSKLSFFIKEKLNAIQISSEHL